MNSQAESIDPRGPRADSPAGNQQTILGAIGAQSANAMPTEGQGIASAEDHGSAPIGSQSDDPLLDYMIRHGKEISIPGYLDMAFFGGEIPPDLVLSEILPPELMTQLEEVMNSQEGQGDASIP